MFQVVGLELTQNGLKNYDRKKPLDLLQCNLTLRDFQAKL